MLIRLAVIAGLAGIIAYFVLVYPQRVKPKIPASVSASSLAPIDCAKTNKSEVAYKGAGQPDSCLFTGCSGFFQ